MAAHYSNIAGIFLGVCYDFSILTSALPFGPPETGPVRRTGWSEHGEERAVVGHGSEPVFEQKRSAPLQLIAFFVELLDALENWYDAAHLFANRLGIGEGEKLGAVGHGHLPNEHRNFPLR